MEKYVSTYEGYTIKKIRRRLLIIIMQFFFLIFFIKTCCGYSFELHQQVDAIQMSTHNICLYEEEDQKYTGCNEDYGNFLTVCL